MATPTHDRDDADRLVMAAIKLTRTLQCLTRGGPLTSPQIGALIVITYAKRIVARDLAAHQQVTPATISRLLADLEGRGMIRRLADEKDNRLQWIEPTPEGAALVAREHDRRLAPLAHAVGDLSAEDRRRLDEAIDLINALTGTVVEQGQIGEASSPTTAA